MRALTLLTIALTILLMQLCNNEVLAREGIDTSYMPDNSSDSIICNNEVLAREGIDTAGTLSHEFVEYNP